MDNTPTLSTMNIIYQLNVEMNELINMQTLLPHLNSYLILTRDERSYLRNELNSPTGKVTYLLGLLESKGDETVKNFLQALKKADEHTGHVKLCSLLKEKGIEV